MLCIAIYDDERIHRRHTAELIDSALAAREEIDTILGMHEGGA